MSEFLKQRPELLEPKNTDLFFVDEDDGASDYKTKKLKYENYLVQDFISGTIEVPESITYCLILSAPYPGTIQRFVTRLAAGTLDAVIQIDGTSVTGTSHGVTTTLNSNTATADNEFDVGEEITMVVSNLGSSPRIFDFQISFKHKIKLL